jgi:hypothetical protein
VPPTSPVAGAPPPTSPDVAAELALLRQAQAALRDRRPARAYELANDHARRFPDGVLTEERAAVLAISSCELGHRDAATAKQLFLARWPRSPLVDRVDRACRGEHP